MSIINNIIKVGIVGSSGYTGGELIRILLNHPNTEIEFVHSKSKYGKKIFEVHKDLIGDTELEFTNKIKKTDVLFLCLGHGNSKEFLKNNSIDSSTKIIDLSQDYRVEDDINVERNFIYGLPELQKEKIKKTNNISNPGCFATAIQLGLIPALVKDYINGEIHTNAITGSTGAGVIPSNTTHFSWRNNNISWYNAFTHRHLNEIKFHCNKLTKKQIDINFIPVRGNFTRGIYCMSYFESKFNIDDFIKAYEGYYKNHPFVHISKDELSLKEVVNTNKCIIHIKQIDKKILITSIIDNLIKGASGQAIQNMNLMYGLDEKLGLKLKSTTF